MRKRKDPEKKQRQDDLSRIRNLAAAFYWVVKLIRETWDWFNR